MTVRLDLRCSPACAGRTRVEAASPGDLPRSAACCACARSSPLHLERLSPAGGLAGCLACGHPELFARKDFPPLLGLAIVIAAAVAVPFVPDPWARVYPTLIVAAAADALLWRFAPEVLVCYVCRAEHRGFAHDPRHPSFDRGIEERLRYGDRAVMGSAMRPGGTAGAPDPEH